MSAPSASKVGLAIECAFPWSQHAPEWPRDPQGAGGILGDAVHSEIERALSPETRGGEWTGHTRQALAALDELTGETGSVLHVERKLLYSPARDAARWDDSPGRRRYARRGDELGGTPDVIVHSGDGRIVIIDWKTGRGAQETPASETWQMRTLGCAVARLLTLDEVDVALVHLEEDDYQIDRAPFAPWDLDGFRSSLLTAFARLNDIDARPRPGPWCRDSWCPIRTVCPATQAALAAIEAEAAALLPPGLVVDSPERARSARTALKLYDEAARRLKSSLEDFVRSHGPVEIADGVLYGLVEQRREAIDLTHESAAIVREMVGEAAIEVSTSKAAIERAAKATQTKRGEGMERARATVERLRAAGAVRESTYARFEEWEQRKAG